MTSRTLILLAGAAFSAAVATAHEGHGIPGASHWHAGDTGVVLAAIAVAAALWFKLRK